MRRVARVGAVLVALVGASTDARAQAGDPATQTQAARISLQVERFTGAVDRHCGILLLPPGADGRPEAVGRRAIANAVRCIVQARRLGRRTWAMWQVPGIDSTAFAGLATSGLSDVHRIEADSMGPTLRLTPCLRPRLDKHDAVTCRNRPGPTTADELADTLEDLERDVRRAVGSDGAVAIAAAAQAPADVANIAERPALVMRAAQAALQPLANGPWPACPYHHDHVLQVRDRYWLCDRDGVFVAEVGRLPKHPRPRPLR